jgi:hypothetical protein
METIKKAAKSDPFSGIPAPEPIMPQRRSTLTTIDRVNLEKIKQHHQTASVGQDAEIQLICSG